MYIKKKPSKGRIKIRVRTALPVLWQCTTKFIATFSMLKLPCLSRLFLPPANKKVMFLSCVSVSLSVHSPVPPYMVPSPPFHCTRLPELGQTYSTWMSLYHRTTPPPYTFKRAHFTPRTVGKRAVCILLECFLVISVNEPLEQITTISIRVCIFSGTAARNPFNFPCISLIAVN